MNLKKAVITAVATGTVFAATTGIASAATKCPDWVPGALCGTTGVFDVQALVKVVLYIVIAAGVLWSLWNIIRAGFEYSSAGDDAEKKKKSTSRIISAVIGLVIVVISFTVLSLVAGWFTKGNLPDLLGQPCMVDGNPGVAQKDDDWPETCASGYVCIQIQQDGTSENLGCVPE